MAFVVNLGVQGIKGFSDEWPNGVGMFVSSEEGDDGMMNMFGHVCNPGIEVGVIRNEIDI